MNYYVFMFSRFKKMHKGYFRLLVGSYFVALPLIAIPFEAATRDGAVIFLFYAGIAYWPIVRVALWIYDGFKPENGA